MAGIAGEKRMAATIGAAVAALVALLLVLAAATAYGVGSDPASSASGSASSSSAAAASNGQGGSASASSRASTSSTTTASPGASSTRAAISSSADATGSASWEAQVEADVESALSRTVASPNAATGAPDGVDVDSGGSAFTLATPIDSASIDGDLYWAGSGLELSGSRIGNDVLAAAFQLAATQSRIGGDARIAGQSVRLSNVVVAGNVDLVGFDLSIDANSAANAWYCGAGSISFEGAAKDFVAYGQSIYFNGVVDGDVTLSAQDIVIGPDARVTGLLDIRSGQSLDTLEIPAEAQIARIDTNLDDPNTIDQIAQIRSAIAPYFQVGSILFIVVSFVLLGLAAWWVFGNKLSEANRLVRRYPLAVLVLGVIALMFMVVVMMIGPVLIFTIPLSIVVALLLLVAVVCCIPFTGASLALWLLDGRFRPSVRIAIGTGAGGALLFVPYVRVVLVAACLVYFAGYLVNIAMFGHDAEYDASFYRREADEDAPGGKASGILPASEPAAGGSAAEDKAS